VFQYFGSDKLETWRKQNRDSISIVDDRRECGEGNQVFEIRENEDCN
jgi:hypothetical protein